MSRVHLTSLLILAAAGATLADTPTATLIDQLASPEVADRESAIRALQSRKDAIPAVIEALQSPDLNRRLGAMELLETWQAPLKGVDPWEKSTLTPARLEALRDWSSNVEQVGPSTQPSDALEAEIARLIAATDEADARVVVERLVRYGEPAIRVLSARLDGVGPGEMRRRLTAARYRVAVDDSRLKASPGLIDQLTSRDATARVAAMNQLASAATAADTRLLQELFSDSDPLIREQALHALRKVGGAESNQVLVQLLTDADANVRAAVLKALGEDESVDAALAPAIQTYVETESDADLVGHAIRVLKVMPGEASARALASLLSHADWRVRAEALEAITPKLRTRYGDTPLPQELLASIHTQVFTMLDDEEPYVVSRALQAVSSARSTPMSVVIKTIERKPELAAQLLQSIEGDSDAVTGGAPQVKPLMTHENALLRAAAVRFVAATRNATYAPAVRDALDDADADVRASAIRGVLAMLGTLRPADGYVETRGFLGFGRKREKVDVGEWLAEFRAGTGQPEWVKSAAEKITGLFPQLEGDTRAAAAVVLVAVGRDEVAYEPLKTAAASPELAKTVLPALSWLPEEKRVELFKVLNATFVEDEKYELFRTIAETPSPKVRELLWSNIASLTEYDDAAARLVHALELQYGGRFGNDWHMMPESDRASLLKEIEARARTGPEIQRAAALQLAYEVDPSAAGRIARSIYDDPNETPTMRKDAFQVTLLSSVHSADGTTFAAESLKDENVRELAVRFLAAGSGAIQGGASGTRPFKNSRFYSSFSSGNAAPALPDAAKKNLDLIRPYASSKDQDFAAYASYLLVIAGEKDHFKTLEHAWSQSEDIDSSPYTDLVVRAIAASNDPTKVPLLERIYESKKADSPYDLRNFYWTIRPMTGAEVLALRKRMRAEVGMEQLRQY